MKHIKKILWPIRKLLKEYKIIRLVVLIFFIWLLGASILWVSEGTSNPEFNSLPKSLWNIAVYLFSGLDSGVPETTFGKVIVAFILITSLGIVGIFTATLASLIIEHRIGGKRKMPNYELKDHIVICNWNNKGEPLIKEVHAKIVKDKRPIVIISEQGESIQFPEHEDAPEYEDIYIINGDPANEVILKRANVQHAYTTVILADPTQGELADAKSILIAMGIKSVCEELRVPKTYIAVEGISPQNIEHLRRAGADEIISAGDFSTLLLAQTSLVHGLSKVYRNLLTISEETNEIYLIPIPKEYIGKKFSDLGAEIFSARDNQNPVIPIGVRSGNLVLLNPKVSDFDAFQEGDDVIVIAFELPSKLI
ncbi:MAG: NAD-binding protein [Candidatus Aminicenantes bacterium]|nr:NAD-binding protein [Candidatus Aminicenantes bacterium]MDH5384749.1 NAD-binding protein [Candidatus Aminicenantes bacterium]